MLVTTQPLIPAEAIDGKVNQRLRLPPDGGDFNVGPAVLQHRQLSERPLPFTRLRAIVKYGLGIGIIPKPDDPSSRESADHQLLITHLILNST